MINTSYTTEESENVNLFKRKGVYPYEYMDSFEKFDETNLPNKEKFYSSLNDEHISGSDYEHALNVWNKFDFNPLLDYHDLHLKTHVLLLSDVFENFTKTCLHDYGLYPCYYFSTPRLAWVAM